MFQSHRNRLFSSSKVSRYETEINLDFWNGSFMKLKLSLELFHFRIMGADKLLLTEVPHSFLFFRVWCIHTMFKSFKCFRCEGKQSMYWNPQASETIDKRIVFTVYFKNYLPFFIEAQGVLQFADSVSSNEQKLENLSWRKTK